MDKDTRFAVLVLGLPFLGLLYCLLIILFFMMSPIAQNHPLLVGIISAIVPFIVAVTIWIRASAKAYDKSRG